MPRRAVLNLDTDRRLPRRAILSIGDPRLERRVGVEFILAAAVRPTPTHLSGGVATSQPGTVTSRLMNDVGSATSARRWSGRRSRSVTWMVTARAAGRTDRRRASAVVASRNPRRGRSHPRQARAGRSRGRGSTPRPCGPAGAGFGAQLIVRARRQEDRGPRTDRRSVCLERLELVRSGSRRSGSRRRRLGSVDRMRMDGTGRATKSIYGGVCAIGVGRALEEVLDEPPRPAARRRGKHANEVDDPEVVVDMRRSGADEMSRRVPGARGAPWTRGPISPTGLTTNPPPASASVGTARPGGAVGHDSLAAIRSPLTASRLPARASDWERIRSPASAAERIRRASVWVAEGSRSATPWSSRSLTRSRSASGMSGAPHQRAAHEDGAEAWRRRSRSRRSKRGRRTKRRDGTCSLADRPSPRSRLARIGIARRDRRAPRAWTRIAASVGSG